VAFSVNLEENPRTAPSLWVPVESPDSVRHVARSCLVRMSSLLDMVVQGG